MLRRKKHDEYKNDKVEIIDLETDVRSPFNPNKDAMTLNGLKEHFYKNPDSKLLIKGFTFFQLIEDIREQESKKAFDSSFNLICELIQAIEKAKHEGKA